MLSAYQIDVKVNVFEIVLVDVSVPVWACFYVCMHVCACNMYCLCGCLCACVMCCMCVYVFVCVYLWQLVPTSVHIILKSSSMEVKLLTNVSILRIEGRYDDNSSFFSMVSKGTGICSRMNKICFNEAVHNSTANFESISCTGN